MNSLTLGGNGDNSMRSFLDRNGDKIALDARVMVRPKTTNFDRPIWTMRSCGTVTKLGRTRVFVDFDGTDYVNSFHPYDLEIIKERS